MRGRGRASPRRCSSSMSSPRSHPRSAQRQIWRDGRCSIPIPAPPIAEGKIRGGRSLLDPDPSPADRSIYSETYYPRLHFGWNDLHSLIAGPKHYIHGTDPELYDVSADPAETKNVLLDDRRTYT